MTRLEWFNTFPEPWKSQAIANCPEYALGETLVGSTGQSGFHWSATPQGRLYWARFFYDQERAEIDRRQATTGAPL